MREKVVSGAEFESGVVGRYITLGSGCGELDKGLEGMARLGRRFVHFMSQNTTIIGQNTFNI